jgi:hypothetical protein
MPAGMSPEVVRKKPGLKPSWNPGATCQSVSRPKLKIPLPGDWVQ